jgi:hypothetical protein
MWVSDATVAVEACTNLADQLTQRRQEAKTQRAGRWEGKDGLESLTQRMKLLRNPNPCVSIKGFTHSLVHVKHLRDWLDHGIQATLEVGWHWKYGYCDPNEPHDSRSCWGFWRGHGGAAEEAGCTGP